MEKHTKTNGFRGIQSSQSSFKEVGSIEISNTNPLIILILRSRSAKRKARQNEKQNENDVKEKERLTAVKRSFSFVTPFGFEPKTYCLEGSCSIQLSYGTSQKKNYESKI